MQSLVLHYSFRVSHVVIKLYIVLPSFTLSAGFFKASLLSMEEPDICSNSKACLLYTPATLSQSTVAHSDIVARSKHVPVIYVYNIMFEHGTSPMWGNLFRSYYDECNSTARSSPERCCRTARWD